jgi:hypothetical protein
VTLGALRFRLSKAFPGLDPDLLDGWIQDTHSDILGELPWSRQQATGILQTTAPYTTGTVTVTNESTTVTGSGTTFTSGMTGRAFRIAGRDEYYEFTYVSSTSGTLDRGYEGDTASGASYSIFQFVYPLPTDCRILQDDAFPSMTRLTGAQMDATGVVGTPTNWASYMDDASTPPRMQIELYPTPDESIGIPFTYTAEAADLSGASTILKAWVDSTALVEGVTAKIKAHLKDYTGAAYHATLAQKALDSMKATEAHGMAPTQMQLSSHYTGHRARRWSR